VFAFVECGTYQAAADAMGVSRQYVHQQLRRVRQIALSIATMRQAVPARSGVDVKRLVGSR